MAFDDLDFDRLMKIMQVAKRLKRDQMRALLKMDEAEFNAKLPDWVEQFDFSLEGDYILIKRETAGEFIESLQAGFGDWGLASDDLNAEELFDFAREHLRTGEVKAALDALERVIQENPNKKAAWILLGDTLLTRVETTDLERVTRAYESALAIDPDDVIVWEKLADTRLEQRDFDGRVAAFKRALTFSPRNATLWNKMATAFEAMNDAEAAMQAHKRALNLDPTIAGIWFDFGIFLKKEGQEPEALYCWEKAQQLGDSRANSWAKSLHEKGIEPSEVNL